MESLVTVVVTSCNRLELLKRAIWSFVQYNTYPIEDFIIIDDSANIEMHKQLRELYPNYTLILNGRNIGLIDSIDRAYPTVRTKYVFHMEDDWEFVKPGFIEPSLKIIENNHMIMQVWISNIHGQPVDPDIQMADGIPYKQASLDGMDHLWHGFTFHPGIRSMRTYREAAPWSQWSPPEDFLAKRECKIGEEYFRRQYRAAVLMDSYCVHNGGLQSTWNIGQK
jgi:hypothetical protein